MQVLKRNASHEIMKQKFFCYAYDRTFQNLWLINGWLLQNSAEYSVTHYLIVFLSISNTFENK